MLIIPDFFHPSQSPTPSTNDQTKHNQTENSAEHLGNKRFLCSLFPT